MKTICIYNYYEKDDTYKENLKFFLKNGLNDSSDFLFVVNGSSTVLFPRRNNLRVVYRKNEGYDFMAFSHGLNIINIHSYDYFIFVNTSVRGPYMKNTANWQSVFTDMINKDVKLVGTTINIFCVKGGCHWPYENKLAELGLEKPYTHVQSMMFAMDRECLYYLKDRIFLEKALHRFDHTILYKEIMMTQFVLNNNWNINCTAPLYKGYDYRELDYDINPTSRCGDSYYPGGYFGKTLIPDDVIFIKTNRDIINLKNDLNYYYLSVLSLPLIILIIIIVFHKKN